MKDCTCTPQSQSPYLRTERPHLHSIVICYNGGMSTILEVVCACPLLVKYSHYIDYPNKHVSLFGVTHCYNYLMRRYKSTKKSEICSIMSEQHVKLSLVEIEVLSKSL